MSSTGTTLSALFRVSDDSVKRLLDSEIRSNEGWFKHWSPELRDFVATKAHDALRASLEVQVEDILVSALSKYRELARYRSSRRTPRLISFASPCVNNTAPR